MLLDRDAILAADDLVTLRVAVPAWGGEVGIRTMSAAERDAIEDAVLDGDRLNLRARQLVHALVDAAGRRLFSDEEAGALGAKSAAVLDKLFELSTSLNSTAAVTVTSTSELDKLRTLLDAIRPSPPVDPLAAVADEEPRAAWLRSRLRTMADERQQRRRTA